MYVFLVNSDNTITASKKERIMERSKLVDKLWFLTAPEYNGYDMSKFTAVLEYISPCSKKYHSEILKLDEEGYQEYLKYVLPFDTKLTSEPGSISLQLSFILSDLDESGEDIQRVRKTSTASIEIVPIAAWSDIIPDESLTAIDQRIIKVDAQIKQLMDIETENQGSKVDNLKYDYDKNTLQLLAGENEIGDKITLKSCEDDDCCDGVDVVDFGGGTFPSAEVNGVTYTSVSDAISNAPSGSVIKIVSSTKENVAIPVGKMVTIDLNGKKLTNVGNKHTIVNNGTLILSDSASGKVGAIDNINDECATILNESGATCTILAGKITRSKEAGKDKDNSGGNSYYVILNHGKMTIGSAGGDNSKISVAFDGHYSSLIDNGWYDGNKNTDKANSELTIWGGSFSGGINTIKNDDWGVLNIYDGKFDNVTQHSLMNWNVASIYGGTFSSNSDSVLFDGYYNDTMDKGELNIYGGIFNGASGKPAILTNSPDVSISVSGGKFSADVSQYLKSGMKQNEIGEVVSD
nr:MAG TPA: hypothetical protein [Caudoviricetes sp.]